MSKVEVSKLATLSGHRDCIYELKEKEGNIFYSSGGDGMVVQWDLKNRESGELIAKTNHSIYALHYIAENNQLLIGENFEGIHVVDLKNKKEVKSAAITESSIFDIQSFGDLVIVATGDGTLIILNKSDLTTISKIKMADKSIRSLAINADLKQMAVAGSDHFIRILDLKNLNVINEFQAHKNSVFTAAYSPNGAYLLSGGRDAHLNIWNTKNNYKLEQSIAAHMFAINHIAFSPDSKYFATCSLDKTIKIWDFESFKLLKVIDKARHSGHSTSVNKLWWSKYENTLVACSDDRTISVWNLNFK